MIPLGILAATDLTDDDTPPGEGSVPIDLSTNVSPVQVTTVLSAGVLVCTTTVAATGQTLPRLQRITTPSATPVEPGQHVTLALSVRHSRAMPISVLAYPLSESGSALLPRPRSIDMPAGGWTPIETSLTIPATGAFLGWQVIVNSSSAVGPSQVGDVWEVRDFRAITDQP